VNAPLRLSLRQEGRSTLSADFAVPVELGRFDPTRPHPDVLFEAVAAGDGVRIAIAEPRESEVSRRQVRMEALADGRVRVTNLSASIAIRCFGRADVAPAAVVELALPTSFQVGRVVVSVEVAGGSLPREPAATPPSLRTLDQPTMFLGRAAAEGDPAVTALLPAVEAACGSDIVNWWRRVIGVLQSASSSTEFFHKAAESLVELVGLHLGAVFLREGSEWKPAAISSREESRARPSTSVLARVLTEKRTFWNSVDAGVDVLSSMASLEAFVAAPILSQDGTVLGALYGHREGRVAHGRYEISELEALLVETLACGVATGLARLEQEKLTLRQKVQFEQFFSPQLSERLEQEPDLLRGRDAEVTVLFCDLRGFSGVSERLGPAQTMEWIGGVLNPLSDEVVATGGVLVDYVGDELLAMWGAPTAQADHAALACLTARRMIAARAGIDEQWSRIIGGPTRFGIGINSCTARVGNTGSARKFKYGPLGNGVNLGSRVQGATKYLRVDAIVTGSTRRLLDDSFMLRRLCAVQVVNIVEPVELFELDCAGDPGRAELFSRYEAALAAFDGREFSTAARLLGAILGDFPGDGPTLVLLSRAVAAMVDEPKDFTPVWRLPGK